MPKATSPMRVSDKGLAARPRHCPRRQYQKPMRRVGAEPHPFPAQVDKQQVVRQRDHQHGKDKQVQVAEIPDVIGVIPHERHGIDVDEAGHEGDHQGHDRGQGIVMHVHGRRKSAHLNPRPGN